MAISTTTLILVSVAALVVGGVLGWLLAAGIYQGAAMVINDMLSAHQPFERFPDLIRKAAIAEGATAQVAGGVPAARSGAPLADRMTPKLAGCIR